MVSFFTCLLVLIGGYFIYGSIVNKIYSPDDRQTPATRLNDGVDYVLMPPWKLFLIQLLNIAGVGPIYGALLGARWGTSVFLWITLGTIFCGAVHDFSVGFMSLRHDGKSISELTGDYLGDKIQGIMRVFSVILLLMVGVVFAVGPAALIPLMLQNEIADSSSLLLSPGFWLVIVFIYYFIATFLPIDKIIGSIYPIFGICLIVMAIGVTIGIFTNGYTIPEISLSSLHPMQTQIWPMMFITVACGAISGFHATQSPIVARCTGSEKQARMVFFGAMVSEGIIALIWAAAGAACYERADGLMTGLSQILASGLPATVYDICTKTMGGVGVVLAMLGVIACPITSGDTAFRSCRLVISDWFQIEQKNWGHRLRIALPLLLTGAVISQFNYDIIWNYFSWSNQTLAMIALWTASMYLCHNGKNYWLTALPATFMSAVTVTYFCYAPECLGCFGQYYLPSCLVGIVTAFLFLYLFLLSARQVKAANSTADRSDEIKSN